MTPATPRRLHVVSWRDLDDPESGGSELHLDHLASRWAAAGLDVTLRTGGVRGGAVRLERHGYRVVRKGGRLTGLVRTPLSELVRAQGPRDALVEVWHGINFLSPLWCRGPRVGIAHHVHGDQFRFVLPGPAARVAELLEQQIAPRLYRGTPLVTLSPSSRDELVALGHRPEQVHVVPPGVDGRYRPGGERTPHPTVLVVGRLMPQKRVELVAEALAPLVQSHPDLELLVVGDGPHRERLATLLPPWARLLGRVDDEQLLELYRRSWIVASGSVAEGWNMTLTEAAACATPAVATRIAGHVDAVVDGRTGILVDDVVDMTRAFAQLLADPARRTQLGLAAVDHAARFTWDAAAARVLQILRVGPGETGRGR